MKKHYDFSGGEKNPYAKMFKRQITIRLEESVIEYFKALSRENGMPYQNLINMYLKDCVQSARKPRMKWAA